VATSLIDVFSQCTYQSTYCPKNVAHLIFQLGPANGDCDFPSGGHFGRLMHACERVRHWLIKYRGRGGSEVSVLKGSQSGPTRRIFEMTTTSNFHHKESTNSCYSVSEAAQQLSCSRNTVYALMRSGEILAVYPTSKARISANALVRFCAIEGRSGPS